MCRTSCISSREDIKPFLTWESHKSISGFDGGYIQDGLEQYLEKIKGNKENLRISGLSGLGKTRMVMEAFNNKNVKYLYAYIDCHTNNYELILENCHLCLSTIRRWF